MYQHTWTVPLMFVCVYTFLYSTNKQNPFYVNIIIFYYQSIAHVQMQLSMVYISSALRMLSVRKVSTAPYVDRCLVIEYRRCTPCVSVEYSQLPWHRARLWQMHFPVCPEIYIANLSDSRSFQIKCSHSKADR